MNEAMIRKYARLVVKTGVNIQKGQTLVITSPIDCAPFVRFMAEAAYQEGAREVVANWRDDLLARIKYLLAPEEIFSEFPDWQKDFYMSYALQGAAFVRVSASDPEVLKGVHPDRLATAQKAASMALQDYMDRAMSNKNSWCVVAAPVSEWAQKVFPGLQDEEAEERLWQAILKSVRADADDPVAAWDEHKNLLRSRRETLNHYRFRKLHLKNSLGTDVTIELPAGHKWLGGSDFTQDGVEFIPNLPTEEIFTLPEKMGVNGRVVSSLPLNYNGNLIKDFSITLKDGRITEYSAGEGLPFLKNLIETDEGSHYLGEVALVPYDSPISNTNTLFYNTLFDENASCHLALGRAYPVCLENSGNMTKDELLAAGVNQSLIHEDFMIGTHDLEITGIKDNGEEVPVFVKGNFAF
jgi:aminopeptidase